VYRKGSFEEKLARITFEFASFWRDVPKDATGSIPVWISCAVQDAFIKKVADLAQEPQITEEVVGRPFDADYLMERR
jgi:hypothetical protein